MSNTSSTSRIPLISGNWKMNHSHFEAIQFIQKLAYLLQKQDFDEVEVSVHAPFTDLRSLQTLIDADQLRFCLLYTSPSPRDGLLSRMPSSA